MNSRRVIDTLRSVFLDIGWFSDDMHPVQKFFQEERYDEEEDVIEERILGSNFSPGRNVEVFELPESEAMFMPTNMDGSQMSFRFKEVSQSVNWSFIIQGNVINRVNQFLFVFDSFLQLQLKHSIAMDDINQLKLKVWQ